MGGVTGPNRHTNGAGLQTENTLRTAILSGIALLAAVGGAAADAPYWSEHCYGFHTWGASATLVASGKSQWGAQLYGAWNHRTADLSRLDTAVADQCSLIFITFDGTDGWEIPPDTADYERFAWQLAYWAEAHPDLFHTWLLGNNLGYGSTGDFTPAEYADCFKKVREAIHNIDPWAIVCPGTENAGGFQDEMEVLVGEWADGWAEHGLGPEPGGGWAGLVGKVADIDQYHWRKYKPFFITEWYLPNYYDGTGDMILGTFDVLGQFNETQNHMVEGTCYFLWNDPWWPWASLASSTEGKAEWTEMTDTTNVRNAHMYGDVGISNVLVQPLNATRALVHWTTDVPASTQVEYWHDGRTERYLVPHLDNYAVNHVAYIGYAAVDNRAGKELQLGETVRFQIKAGANRRPWTVSEIYTYRHHLNGTGEVAATVTDKSGAPLADAWIDAYGGMAGYTDETGQGSQVNVPAGTSTAEAGRPGYATSRAYGLGVPAGGTDSADFVLAPVENILVNGDFETGSAAPWTPILSSGASSNVETGPWFWGIEPYEGGYMLGNARDWGTDYSEGGAQQTVSVETGAQYALRCKYVTFHHENPRIDVKVRIGLDPTGGTDINSPNVVWTDWAFPTHIEDGDWHELQTPVVTATAPTMTVYLFNIFNGLECWHIAAYDDVELCRADRICSTSRDALLAAGWNMVSVPLSLLDNDVPDVLADAAAAGNTLENALFSYEAGAGYDVYPGDFGQIQAAKGYWLYLDTPCQVSVVGADAGATDVGLGDGWNLIGHPHDGPVPLADCTVSDGVTTLSFDDAAAAGWVDPILYAYDGTYFAVRTSGGADDALRPWRAYWALTNQAGLELSVPQP